MKNKKILVVVIMLITSAITLRIDNIYLNILGLALAIISIIMIFIMLRKKKTTKN